MASSVDNQNDSENFKIIKWKIKNFCFWDAKIHEKCLVDCSGEIELFPRGLHADGDHLVVRVYDENASSIEMSYFGSNGALLCVQEVKEPEWCEGCVVLPPGPMFEEVAQARKKNPYENNSLTLICRFKKERNSWYSSQTSLVSHDMYFKVSTVMFESIETGEEKWISRIRGIPIEDDIVQRLNILGEDPADYDGEESADDDNDDPDYTDITAEDEIEEDGYGSGELDLFASITDSGHVEFAMKPIDADFKNFRVHFSLSLLDKDHSIAKSHQGDHIFRDFEMKKWVFSNELLKSEVTKEDHSVIIYLKFITKLIHKRYQCSLSFDECVQKIEHFPSNEEKMSCLGQPTDFTPLAILSQELMALYQDQDHADFHLHCGNNTFATHKGILSARSPVLKSMLSADMKEAMTDSMTITDVDVNTLSRFLSFIYTGTVENLTCENALKLYYAADKYEVPSLKTECRDILVSSVSVSNVCSILSLANKHQDDELLSVTHKFILENYSKVLKSNEWKSFMQNEPLLVSETVTRLTIRLIEKTNN